MESKTQAGEESKVFNERKGFIKSAKKVIEGILQKVATLSESTDRRTVQDRIQDDLLACLFRIALFIRKKYSSKSFECTEETKRNIIKGFGTLVNFMIVKKSMKMGTNKELMDSFNAVYKRKGESAYTTATPIPQNINPFGKKAIMDERAERKHRNGRVKMLIEEWYKVMYPRYKQLVIGDSDVLNEIASDNSIGAKIIGYLNLTENWNAFSTSEQRTIMRKLHNVTALCLACINIDALKKQKAALEAYEKGLEEISATSEGDTDDIRQAKLEELHGDVFGKMEDFLKQFNNMKPGMLKESLNALKNNKKQREQLKVKVRKMTDLLIDDGYKLFSKDKKERESMNKNFRKIIKGDTDESS